MTAKSIIGIVVVLAFTIYPGYYHGLKSFRWGKDQRVQEISARLSEFPTEFQGWKMVSENHLRPSEADMLVPIEYISRAYSRDDHQLVYLFVLLGPTGPSSVHTPDICFSSLDYSQIGSRRQMAIGNSASSQSQCWESEFLSKEFGGTCVKSCYAWTVDGQWHAADNPRYSFARSPWLIKIQVEARFPDRQSMDSDRNVDAFANMVHSYLKNNVLNGS